ncbi:MAG: hypothetical protein PUC30_07140 [Lachnospiraceae bacterium]|nr:hypothetical protein [Lachnospiraceae bacterium]
MLWGYNVGSGVTAPLPIKLDNKSHCHALITGSSGSGKSYGMLFLIGSLLKENPEIDIYLCDFKNSEDFVFLSTYVHYYGGNDCYKGVMEYYNSFCEGRENKTGLRRKLLIFDEYPAAISYYSTKDKQEKTKYATDLLNSIAEILMLGRGIGYGVWIVTQRADASLFANGARDNFMIFLGLGRMSKEQKGMIFAGEDVPSKVYQRGEGCLLADGCPLMEVKIPKIKNIVNWKRHIKDILCGKS